MRFESYYLACLSHASYLIADESSGVAAVIDPQRDVDQYVLDAERLGVAISHVLLTHFHADFVSGHLELRDRCGATIHLGAAAEAEYAFEPARDGDVLELGPEVRFQFLATPGHTPESTSILVFDRRRSDERPHAVLTGDTLFIGDVGRPDLLASFGVTAEDLAGRLYDSLHGKLLTLPDETLVHPAHGAGSACGRNLSTERVSTIGDQRRYNHALQPMSRDDFIRMVTADQPEAPAYFAHAALLNRQERPTLEATLPRTLSPLTLAEALSKVAAGAQLLDVREPVEFAGGHLRGALNVALGGRYANWCGSLLDRERPIVVVAEPGREEEAATRLGRIGFDHVAGYLDGGMLTVAGRDDLLATTARLTARDLAERLAASEPPAVLDVRTAAEHGQAAIEGSLHVPLSQLAGRLDELPRDGQLVVHCATGYRSSIASSLLQRAGFTEVADLVGGFGAWQVLHGTGGGACSAVPTGAAPW